jgi:RNA polymerase sigma-70 factor (ECF subfamily)
MGDARSFEAMVLATEGALRAYLAGMGVGRHAVDDIAQEAYVAVWQQGVPDGVEPLRWLKGIARRKAVDQLRAASPRRRAVVEIAELAAEGAAEEAPALTALRGCLARLEPAQHELLRRHYAEDETSDAIARAGGVDGSTIRKQLIRLRESLERCIVRALSAGGP